ncbi:hypothetical protein [Mesorhizobium sp.]|uniref:hypothetical protein n=1 Tax=Mesorhizobium sp. TaxID=1871066 RepID=UPI0012060020|nr:hypothetical protein [Mesorhizobium sp.]TIS45954.1 MAG: hypothetical protein E5W96_28480 [Mesorhizobium sp.]
MTNQFRLIGYADTVGKGLGFLIPVFEKRRANAIFVQRISNNGSILSFEEVNDVDCKINYVDPVTAAVGEQSFWAFSFSENDIVAERIGAFRAILEERINDPALNDRPLLLIEIAEFLNLPKLRLSFIRTALDKIGKANPRAAKNWLDLSILTTDIRKAIARRNPSASAYARRIVASTEGNQVTIRSAVSGGESGVGFEFKEVVEEVLEQLSSVYPSPIDGWKVQFIRSSGIERKPIRPEAVVWLADSKDWEAQTYIQDNFGWRIDAYRRDEVESFKAAALSLEVPAFVVLRSESARTVEEIEDANATRIQLISQARLKTTIDDDDLFGQSKEPLRVCVPMGGFLGTKLPASTTSRIIRQVIAATLSANEYGGRFELIGRCFFFRTTGSGVAPSTDAWATLYDKAVATELSTENIYTLASLNHSFQDENGGAIHDLLFPNSSHLRDRRVDSAMSHSKAHAAILLQAKRRDHRDWRAHVRAVAGVLSHRGWRPQQGNDERDLNLEINGSSKAYLLRTRSEPMDAKPYWNLSEVMRNDLSSISTLAFSADGNAPNILSRLYDQGQLAVNMRDLCGSEARDGIWSILAAQLRRLASGQMNRARSHFMALLINNAFRQNRVASEQAGPLEDAIYGPSLGKEVELMWSRVRQTPGETRASVRLLAGMANTIRQPGSDLVQPFSIALRADGIHILNDIEF